MKNKRESRYVRHEIRLAMVIQVIHCTTKPGLATTRIENAVIADFAYGWQVPMR